MADAFVIRVFAIKKQADEASSAVKKTAHGRKTRDCCQQNAWSQTDGKTSNIISIFDSDFGAGVLMFADKSFFKTLLDPRLLN